MLQTALLPFPSSEPRAEAPTRTSSLQLLQPDVGICGLCLGCVTLAILQERGRKVELEALRKLGAGSCLCWTHASTEHLSCAGHSGRSQDVAVARQTRALELAWEPPRLVSQVTIRRACHQGIMSSGCGWERPLWASDRDLGPAGHPGAAVNDLVLSSVPITWL